ncbi:protein bassoon isoform X1 [Pangasianodon hypophthalmus]|uniref:protein bassoon isoform X1 n=1 Tax=Pangasianodon hypophthalmus TaxID=310915 RepID=UPI002306FBB3|nr:protein bassoon isoform X1 [Pangasianodon hypophthalmus]XP_053092439.1 protein bassoon isoform X1 [Pangasianodon hypophthalmus]XP_053092440.1 protein bassoon isoform X1 [Pangasianodon hypophthalmus]
MGNEASLEGGEGGSVLGVAGAPGSVSASPGSGQHIKPVNGAAAGGGAAMGTGTGMNRLAGAPTSPKTGYGSSGGVGVGGGGLGMGSMGGMPGRGDTYRLATHESPRPSPTPQSQNQATSQGMGTDHGPGQHASRRNLQVDFSSGGSVGRSGRSPSVSPDRGSAPSSPYSVPQIAPMPSSKLCPICNTTELTNADRAPNFNKCTQCRTTVCNQCGFNPNPHLTEVQEWLCLNCQMQRALGMDMTTPRSKSQQQIHASSQQPKADPVIPPHSQPSAQPKLQTQHQTQPHTKIQPPAQSQASLGPQTESETYQKGPQKSGLSAQTGPSQIAHQGAQSGSQSQSVEFRQRGPGGAPQTSSRIPHPGAVPLPGLAKAPSQPDLGRASPVHRAGRSENIRSAGSSPARRPASVHETPPQDGLTKLFGFGASLLNQASTLISVDPLPGGGASAQPSPARQQGTQGTKVIFSDANAKAKAMTGAPDLDKRGTGGTMLPQGPHIPPQKQPQQQQQSMASHQQKASQLPAHHQKGAQQQSPAHHHTVLPQQQSPAHHQKAAQQQPTAHHQKAPPQQQSPLKQVQKSKVSCPLCKTELNIGSSEPPNYNSCTQCHTQVCNMCGFNPTPHLVEKKEWLCLNCQTQRLMSGGLDDSPLHVPYPSPKHQQVGSPRHQVLTSQQPAAQPTSQKVSTKQQEVPNAMPRQQKTPAADGSAPVAATEVKMAGDTKPLSQSSSTPATNKSVSEAQRKDKTMPEMISEPEHVSAVTEETKPTYKKGTTEPIVTTTTKDEKKDSQQSRYYEETSKTNSTHDLSRSPQSLSDTGYSSDGISSSHSEITGLIHEEEMKLSEKSMSGNLTPPSPSEITKLESSMRPLLESKVFSEGEKTWDKQRGRERHHRDPDDRKHRSQSLSISPEQYDSDEDLEDIMEEEEDPTDWEAKRELRTVAAAGEPKKKKRPEPADITDEEFMRRQIMEMSADEENEDEEDEEELEEEEEEEEEEEDDEGYGYQKPKKIHKHISDSGKEKRRLTHHSSSFEEGSKTTCEIYKGSAEEGEEDLIGSQGGLRRFKTIELNNTNSYSRDMELNNENDLSLDREPELEMESLTGSPEERSRGEYSSTLPPTTSTYNSGTSPTSVSSMEDDSDSSPSRRQRLEEAKQQRKARHRSHGPLLPTIEDSSEEDELREEEELLREQEKMREVEQQRIRSTARKTKRDKEELRAQRRRERSKTPPSNLSPIEDASPTEELRQAAEMEELHRSSCSEYSPSVDSEAEGFEMSSKLYKSGSEYNLPTFMLLYSPTEKPETSSCSTITTTSSSGKPLKSAEEVYEEMMKKAEMLQKQQKQQQQQQQSTQLYSTSVYQEDDRRNGQHYEDEYDYIDQDDTGYENEEASDIYEEIRQTSQIITKQLDDQVEMDVSYADKQLLDTGSAFAKLLEQSNALLTPGTSPTQLSAPVSFSETGTGGRIPDVRVTQHFSKDGHKDRLRGHAAKNAIIPSTAATTITAYGVYARDAVHVSQTTTSQTMTSQQSTLYGRHTSSSVTTSTSTSSVSNKIAEITQAYNEREGRRASDRVQIRDSATQLELVTELRSHNVHAYYKGSPPLSPTSPPTHIPARSPSRKTAEFSTQTFSPPVIAPSEGSGPTSPIMAQATQTPHRSISPRLFRQQSSQDATFVVITIGSEATSPPKPVTVNTATSPLSSPTKFSHPSSFDAYSPPVSPPDTPPHQQSPLHGFYRTHKVERVNVGTSMVTAASSYARGSLSMENISLCRISTVPGTSRVEQGQKLHSASVADLRTAIKSSPIIITDQGMDLTSLATESRKYASSAEGSPIRHSTTIQPLIMNLNAQEQPHVVVSTATTVSVTVAASMFISQPKHPVVYGDPLQNRTDLGQGMGTVVCLVQNKQPPVDPSIPNIDAKLEDLSIQQQQLLKQQQKLQQQQQLLEQQLQQHHQLQQQQASSFAKLSLSNQFPLLKKDLIVTQTSTAPVVNAISPALAPEIYNIGSSMELKGKLPVQPQVMMVHMDSSAQGKPLTQLIKSEESQDARDLTGQIKKENQVACCDVVYNLPFGGSCVGGPFSQKPMADEMTNVSEPSRPPSAPPQLYEPIESKQDKQIYHDFTLKSYTLPFPGRLQPSLSETNIAEAGLQSYSSKPDMQSSVELSMDLNSVKHGYEGGFLGMGLQYGSYTDLRQGDVVAPTLPMRRYSSLSNISSDYGYSSCDLSSLPESNLAQYSATTAKEISRMCAALNSMDRYGSNPDLLQLGRGGGPPGRINLQQSLRPSFIYGPDGKPFSQALTSLINARQASLRAMYPSAIRSADGMIYSTINTPIASTVPITTQPASVLHPLLRGVYRPYLAPNMTPVPLASLNRMPVAPRMPLTGQTPYSFPTPSPVSVTTSATANDQVAITTEQDAPIYLGKSPVSSTGIGTSAVQSTLTTTMPTQVAAPANTSQSQEQPLNLSQPHLQTQGPSQPPVQLYRPTHSQLPQPSVSKQPPPPTQSTAATASTLGGLPQEKEIEEERLHRQQEKLLQLERERIELEKFRQLRLQEELERERAELQRHREKEHMLVQREIQELQTIKQQVLQQQQAERESQLVMQREQLAQQKQQLDQIQSLQQQLQQHLEEQKRQKSVAVAAATSTQLICDQSGRVIQPQDLPPDMQHGDIQVPSRSLPNSASEMCLRNNEGQADNRSMRKQRSMPRLQDGIEGEVTMFSLPTRIVDSSVQTDDEDEEERYLMSRRRRTRRSVDCSVQTDDDEDKAEWEQPVRRRRSRLSRHSESSADPKTETSTLTAKVTSSSIAIQTIQDCSCQTEIDQLGKISPAIHVTVSDPNKVEIVHYISGPERTQKGQSLACQTDPESHSQGVVVPQINVATTISPYSSSAQLVGSADPLSSRPQGVSKFERRKPDPLDIGYQQHHLHSESMSSVIRQPPKSPQVLYSPVSPSSPHRIIETSFSSSERLNKAHVTPQQKSYTAESPQRHQSLPRPMKNVQRSLSDPKPLSPTTDEQTKARISLYQQQALQSQLMALQQSSLLRKVKRTLPSPPPEETQLSMVTHALPQMYVPSLPSLKVGSRPGLAAKASLLKDLTHELKAVEQESTKLRKQQAELEEEEKEIDAKLRYLEMGITQRKETLVKERERRELAYLRCMGDTRDYMSDSELNNLRLAAAATSESNGLLTRPSTAPLSQFSSELNTAAQFPPTSSFVSYQFPQSQSTATTLHASTFQSTGFSQPPYPTVSQAQALPQPTPLQTIPHHPTPSYHSQGTFPSQSFPSSQPPYPTEHTMLPPTGFQPPPQPPVGQTPYPTHTTPYPSQAPPYPVSQASTYQPLADILTVNQRPRQTSLADLEHKMPTNYEVINNPSVVVTTTAQDSSYSQSGLVPSYGQYSTAMASTYGPYSTSGSSTYGGYSTTIASSYGPYTTTSANSYCQYTTTTPNTYGHTTTTGSSYGQYTTTVANTYGQTTLSDHMHSVDSPSAYTGDGLYSSSGLEQNVPRNYVMIDDISELTKEGMGTTSDPHRSEGYGRHGGDGLHTRGGSSYGRPEDERDAEMYDHHHGRGKSTGSYQARGRDTHGRVVGSSSMGGGSTYYYDDYKHSTTTRAAQRHSSKTLAPVVMSTKRNKHRKQGLEQKISKFSPIEEARDVEADLASYTMSTSTTSGYGTGSHSRKLQDEIYGLRQTMYDPHRGYYDDEHFYGYGRSRSAGYGMDKISRETGYRSRSYERDYTDRSHRSSYGRSGRPTLRSQYSEEESPLSPMGKFMGSKQACYDPSYSYGSSHSLPDVQDHIRDLPRTHVYKPDDMYIIDDMYCAVSDSEAYHLGQEETDWFEKPRDVRGSRHYSSSHSSSGRRGHVKHTYHDYDEPPEEDLWPQDDYSHSRHTSSREHRHHSTGSSGRHSSSRHSDEPRSSRSSRSSKDPSIRHDSRSVSSSSAKRGDSRSQGYHSSDYSRDPSGHHHGSRTGKQSSHHQGSSSRKQQDPQGHLSSSRQMGSTGSGQRAASGPSNTSRQPGSQQIAEAQPGQRTQLQQQAQTSAARPGQQTPAAGAVQSQPTQVQQLQAKPGQTSPATRAPAAGVQPAPATAKPEPVTAPVTAIGAKAATPQPAKAAQPPLTGIGSKAAPRPGGIGSAAAAQPGMEGESMLSKILPGGAAEQAGKLGEAISGFGKKFTSLW